jgi:hypothetical protein
VSNIKKFQAAGMVAKRHTLSKSHQKLLESLTGAEVNTLVRVKKKLGNRLVMRTASKNAKVRAETFIL